jgi:anthranilate phosphoribosyltransferase
VHDLLRGKTGPVRDAVLLNAAAALVALDGPGDDLATDIGAAYERAAQAVDSGRGAATLDRWIEISRSLQGQA